MLDEQSLGLGLVRAWDAFREMGSMQEQMNRLLADWRSPASVGSPALNAWANDDGLVVTAELPGVRAEDLDVTVVGQTLAIRGVRKPEPRAEGDVVHRRERRHAEFIRTLELPFRVDAGKIDAQLRKGILTIRMPWLEADKPRKIAVSVSY